MSRPAQTELAYQTRPRWRPWTSSPRTRASRPESTGSKQHQHHLHQQVHILSRLILFVRPVLGWPRAKASVPQQITEDMASRVSAARRQVKRANCPPKTRGSTLGPTGNSKVSRGLVSRCPLVGLLRRRTGGAPVWSGLPCLVGLCPLSCWAGPWAGWRDRGAQSEGEARASTRNKRFSCSPASAVRTDEQQPIRGMFQMHSDEVPSYQGR